MKELIEIQSRLNAPKNQYNAFGKYKYRNCEDIYTGLKPLLKELSCTLIVNDELVMVGERYYIKATATLKNNEGLEVTTNGYAREEESKKGMDGSQVTGASSSYARKYALNGLFCIDDVKDSDTGEHKEETKEVYTMTQKDVENWNGKIYAGKEVYINGEKKTIGEEQIKKLEAHEKFKPNDK